MNRQELIANLRALTIAKGISQEEVSRHLNVSYRTISRWFNNPEVRVHQHLLKDISNYLESLQKEQE